jgi:hypothetical protein
MEKRLAYRFSSSCMNSSDSAGEFRLFLESYAGQAARAAASHALRMRGESEFHSGTVGIHEVISLVKPL